MAICIAGMHRSGTSMVARLLNLCGLYLGTKQDLIRPTGDNPEGYWEHARLVDLNNTILSLFEGGWDLPPQLSQGWFNHPTIEPLKKKFEWISHELSKGGHWGWKDPRNSLTIDFWKALVPDLRVVICVRNPREVAKSLYQRAWCSDIFAFNLWKRYNQTLLDSLQTEQYTVTHYESYFLDPLAELRRVTKFARLDATEDCLHQAAATIKTALWRNRVSIGPPPQDIARLYDQLCSRAGDVFRRGRPSKSSLPNPHGGNRITARTVAVAANQKPQSHASCPVDGEAAAQRDIEKLVEAAMATKKKGHRRGAGPREDSLPASTRSSIDTHGGVGERPSPSARTDMHRGRTIRAIAFYLPQYHPIPENDRWWGKGFTEWTNVTKAKPLFPGHYQPHLPKDLGFYDLRLPEVREEQAWLAKEYGIYGFCYYHYWFNGKRLLNRPLDEILSTKKPEFPFCLCWANEHWTRAWDGRQGEILMHQEFNEEDDRNHIQWLLKVFQDKRYIRINEKPLMIVYLSTRLPNASRTAEIWRTEAEKAGEELYLCKVESAPYEYGDPRLIGFDACIEFQPDWGNLGPYERSIENGHVVFNYEAVVNRMLNKEIAKYKRYPCVTPMWDNSPRRQQSAVIFDNSSPAVYAKWLGTIANNISKYNLDDSIVFINAWNEWGEGNHLEPDLKHERKYLEATKQALLGAYSSDTHLHNGLVSIVILTCNQIRYTQECFGSIQKYTQEPHEIIFVDNGSTDGTTQWLQQIVQTNHHCRLIQNSTNLGFSRGSNQGIQAAIGEYVLLLNNDVVVTKNWLGGLLECFDHEDRIGIVGPMTNNISGPQKVPHVDYASVADLHGYARAFRIQNRYRRIPNRRVVGFCMLFKRRLIEEIGLLDESFGSGNFEDDDLCLRACLAGYRNLIAGDVFIHHYGSRTFVGNKNNHSSSLNRNRKVFQDKWRQLDIVKRFGKRLIIQNGIFHAEEYFRKDDLEKATATILDAIKQAPDERQLYIQLAQMLIERKRFDDALGILTSLPEKKADSKQYALIGYCHEALGNDRSAEDFAAQALATQPASVLALNVKGVLAFKRNEKAAAEAWFRRAIESDPSFGESYTNLGSLKWEAGEQDEALGAFERGFILSPTIDDVATAYHTAVVETKSFGKAEAVFREARALHPNHKRLAFLMIALLLQQEKYEPAMFEIETAMIQYGIDDGILSAGLEVRKRIGALHIDKSKSRRVMVSLCMIVKNEEAHLAKCLMSVRPVVDEMIVVDTGSIDRSKGIAAALGARVFEYPWTNDFSEARNYSLAQASGDWILVLDADECLAPMDGALLTKTVKNSKNMKFAYRMITRNYTNQAALRGWTANNGEYYGIEAGEGWIPSVKVRLFPNRKGIAFVGAVHELVEPTLSRLRMRMKDCNVPVHHYGKLDPAKAIKKGPEYFRLGIKKIEDTNGGYQALKELAIQASEIEEYHEAVKIWEKAIATNPTDALAYLNAGYACFMLKQYEKAAILSNKALELVPDLREAALNLAGCEFMLGNVQCAISLLETILAKEPDYPPAMGRLAAVYLIDGRKEEGFKYIRSLHQRNYNAIQLIEEQAQALHVQGRADHALRLHAAIRQFNEHSQNEFLLDSKRPQICVEGNSETPHFACPNIIQLGGQAPGVD